MKPETQGHQMISLRQLMLLGALSRVATTIGTLPLVAVHQAGRDAWLAALVSIVPTLLFVWFLAAVVKDFGADSVAEYARRVAGPTLGVLCGAIYVFLVLLVGYGRLRIFSSLLVVTSLPNTPRWAISTVVLLLGGFIAWRGLDALGRASEYLFTAWLAVFLLFAALGIFGEAELMWLRPVMEHGWRPVLSSSVTSFFWFATVYSTVLAAYPHLDRRTGVLRSLAASVAISGAALVGLSVLVITQYGPVEAGRSLFPVYELAKNMQLGLTLRRLEALALLAWVPLVALDAGLAIWTAGRLLAGISGLQIRHAALVAAALLVVPSGLGKPDLFTLYQIERPGFLGPLALVVVVLTGVLALLGRWKARAGHGKGGKAA